VGIAVGCRLFFDLRMLLDYEFLSYWLDESWSLTGGGTNNIVRVTPAFLLDPIAHGVELC